MLLADSQVEQPLKFFIQNSQKQRSARSTGLKLIVLACYTNLTRYPLKPDDMLVENYPPPTYPTILESTNKLVLLHCARTMTVNHCFVFFV